MKIIVAVLDWGLGHASRSIPIINNFIQEEHEVYLASSGDAKNLLEKEFPNLEMIDLPPYNVSYHKGSFIMSIIQQLPRIKQTIYKENDIISEWVEKIKPDLIFSDNRYGCYHLKVRSVLMTHQLRPLAPKSAFFLKPLIPIVFRSFYKRFNEFWVPDFASEPSLSSVLSHSSPELKPKFIGPLSRFQYKGTPQEYKFKLTVILSGPEPQRSNLEKILRKQLLAFPYESVLVRGVMEDAEPIEVGRLTIYNYMLTEQLEEQIYNSAMVLTRSGYSSIMDLSTMKKKALFVPTPGQTEQEFLAEELEKKGIAPYMKQDEFQLKALVSRVGDYSGF